MKSILSSILLLYLINFSTPAQSSFFAIKGLEDRKCQLIKYQDFSGTYKPSWTSEPWALSQSNAMTVGDYDNDGVAELLIGSDSSLIVFEPDNDTPSIFKIESPIIAGNVIIVDLDNDSQNEVVLNTGLMNGYVLVYKVDNGKLTIKAKKEIKDCWVINIGDADNDGKQEIVAGILNAIHIFSYDGTILIDKYSISSRGWNDMACVGDADNDGKNEIIAGGNYSALRIFKFNGSSFISLASTAVSGYSQSVYVADVDNDSLNETIVATASIPHSSYTDDEMEIYSLVDKILTLKNRIILPSGVGINTISALNLDSDPGNEIFVGCSEGVIYKYSPTNKNFVQIFKEYQVSDFKIWGFNKLVLWNSHINCTGSTANKNGNEYDLILSLKNYGASTGTLSTELLSEDENIIITKGSSNFQKLDYLQTVDNSADPFRIKIDE